MKALLIILLVLLFVSIGFGQFDYVAIVKSKDANIYENPSTDSRIIWTQKKGDYLFFTEEAKKIGLFWRVQKVIGKNDDGSFNYNIGWIDCLDADFMEYSDYLDLKSDKNAPKWTYITNIFTLLWAFETNSVTRRVHIVRAWTKDIEPENNTQELKLKEFNCIEKMSRTLSYVKYVNSKLVEQKESQNTKFSYIVPDSYGEIWLKMLCGISSKTRNKNFNQPIHHQHNQRKKQ